MYQLNILHIKEKKDTYVSYAGDMNICTIKNNAVDNDKKYSTPPPVGKCCHIWYFLYANALCQ